MRKSIVLFAAAVLSLAQTPVFRTEGRLVTVNVTVRNNKGAVRGLIKDDFVLQERETKKNIKVAVFAKNKAGVPAPTAPPLPSGIVSNRRDNRSQPLQGAMVLFLDHLAITPLDQASVAKQILDYLRTLKGTEKIGFYSLYRNLTVVQDFWEDSAPLVRAADLLSRKANPQGLPPRDQEVFNALREALIPTQPPAGKMPLQPPAALLSIQSHMEGIPGSKALVHIGSLLRNPSSSNNFVPPSSGYYEADPSRTPGLGPCASAGGAGLGCTSSSDGTNLHDALQKALLDTQCSYTLGFYVADEDLDGKTHAVNVTLAKNARTSGARVAGDPKYVAANSQRPALDRAPMTELMADPLDATAIELMAGAAPDPSKPGYQSVTVRVNLADVQFDHLIQDWLASFDLALSVDGGNVSVKTMKLKFNDEQYRKALKSGLDVDNIIESPAVNGVLRIVVQDRTTGASGSVRLPIAGKLVSAKE